MYENCFAVAPLFKIEMEMYTVTNNAFETNIGLERKHRTVLKGNSWDCESNLILLKGHFNAVEHQTHTHTHPQIDTQVLAIHCNFSVLNLKFHINSRKMRFLLTAKCNFCILSLAHCTPSNERIIFIGKITNIRLECARKRSVFPCSKSNSTVYFNVADNLQKKKINFYITHKPTRCARMLLENL